MEENYVSVQEFVDHYNSLESDAAKNKYMKSLIRTEYVNYGDKIYLATKIVDASTYEDVNAEIKTVKVNSPVRFLLYVYSMVITYTWIKMDNSKMMAEYDILNRENLVDLIFNYIPSTEKAEFDKIMSMVLEDAMTNNYEIHAFIDNQIGKLSSSIKTLGEILKPEIKDFLKDNLDSIDIGDVAQLLKMLK